MPSNAVMWGSIEAFVLPIAISFIIAETWSEQLKAASAFLICMVCSAITAYFTLGFHGEIVTFALAVTVAAIALYKLSYKPMGLTGRTTQ